MYQRARMWKSVVSWHALYPSIIKFPTLSLLVPMSSTIMKIGSLRLDLTLCMLKQLLGSYSSEKLNIDCWALLKIQFNYHLGSNKVTNYPPSCRFWFPEYLITRSPFHIWDYTSDFYVHFMPANIENLLKVGNKLAKNTLFCLSIIPRKLSFPVLYYLESNHRSKTSTFLIKRSLLTTYSKLHWFKIVTYSHQPCIIKQQKKLGTRFSSILLTVLLKCPSFICWGCFLTF